MSTTATIALSQLSAAQGRYQAIKDLWAAAGTTLVDSTRNDEFEATQRIDKKTYLQIELVLDPEAEAGPRATLIWCSFDAGDEALGADVFICGYLVEDESGAFVREEWSLGHLDSDDEEAFLTNFQQTAPEFESFARRHPRVSWDVIQPVLTGMAKVFLAITSKNES